MKIWKWKHLFWGMIIMLLTYTVLRAIYLSITCDEAWTYLVFGQKSFGEIVFWKEANAANNHILNSVLIRFSTRILGNSEFAIRLPNLIAHFLFLFFSFKLLQKFVDDKFLQLLGFILLNFNPYMLDFFSLGRGYGLASGFMMISLYALFSFHQSKKTAYLWHIFLWGGMAAFSNLTFINYYLAILGAIGLLILIQEPKRLFSPSLLLPIFSITLLFSLLLFRPIMLLRQANELYYGTENGFWKGTVHSMVTTYLYGYHKFKVVFKSVIPILIQLATIIGLFVLVKKSMQKKLTTLFLISLVLGLMILSTVMQHFLLGNLYLQGRAAIVFYPVFFLFTIFLFVEIKKENKLTHCISVYLGGVLGYLSFYLCYILSSFTAPMTFTMTPGQKKCYIALK